MDRSRVGFVGLFVGLIGVVWVHSEVPGTIIACAHKKTGDLRVVALHGECRPSEVEMFWSVEGPQGPPGQVPNGDVLRIAELVGDPAFVDGLPAGILQSAGCDATLVVSGLGAAPRTVVGMIGTEMISRVPRYRILVEGAASDDWLGSPAVVQFDNEQTNEKFGSVATEVGSVGYAAAQSMAFVELGPRAAGLGSNRAYRVFQDTSVPQMIRRFLSKVGQSFDLRFEGSDDPVEMAVQYRESDLDFVTRVLEDAGVFFFLDTDGILVAGDSNYALDREAGSITFGDGVHGRRLTSFRRGARLDLGSVTVIGFDFQDAIAPIVVTAPSGGGDPEAAFFHESIDSIDGAASRAQLELERARQGTEFAQGTSTEPGVRAGRVITVEAGAAFDGDYIVTRVQHVFARDRDGCLRYGNAFAAQPVEFELRPQRVTPRPRIPGPQTAIVVGPSGSEVHTDDYGRIKIQFHWDRDGQRDENSSAWVRVAHPAGPNGSGPPYIPEIGDEVLVVFEQGDPSRPIIVGSMYNGDDTPATR